MRKLVLVGIIGLLLVGCGDNKITNDWLVGEWSCEVSTQKAIWFNGDFTDYDLPKIEKNKLKLFKLENDTLYINDYKNNWFEFNLNSIYEQPKYTKNIDKLNVIDYGERSIKLLSNSKFELKNENKYLTRDKSENIKEISNMKVKTESICTKIK